MLPTRLQLNPEMRRIRRLLAKQLTTCENAFSLFVLDLAGSANAPMDFSENSGRVFNMRKGISDRSTLMNWGNSSSDSLRSHLPTRVMRGSAAIFNTGPLFSLSSLSSASLSSASTHMLRNLYMLNSLPSLPTRFCLKKTGALGSSILMEWPRLRTTS